MTSASDLLQMVSDEFCNVVSIVTPEQWNLPTPCSDWTVLELIGHVVGGSQMATSLVGGASRIEAIGLLATDFVGTDPLGAVDAALAAQREAFDEADLENISCQHPAGDMPAERLLGLRIGDLLIHRWDLARAIGADEQLSPDAVQRVWDDTAPMAPIIAQLGSLETAPAAPSLMTRRSLNDCST